MSDLYNLTQAAEALKTYNETTHADNIHEYVNDKLGRWPVVYSILRSILYWVLILTILVVGLHGVYYYTINALYFHSFGVLFLVGVLYGWIVVMDYAGERLGEHVVTEATKLELEGDGVFEDE